MKIYDKKLSNIRDLRKERQLLKNRIKQKDHESSANETPSSEGEKQSFFSGLLSGVTSGSLLTSALNVAPTVIDIIKRRSSRKNVSHAFYAPKAKKSFVSAAVTDFVSGYIKWKLLELSYKGIKKLINSDAGKKLKRQATSKLHKTFGK